MIKNVDMNYVNCVLLVIILIFVIFCVNKSKDTFRSKILQRRRRNMSPEIKNKIRQRSKSMKNLIKRYKR